MTSTLRRTISAANSAASRGRPSDQRYSIAMVRPSIQPSSCNRATKAIVQGPKARACPPRNPIVGNLLGCPRAKSGHVMAELETTLMKSRRRIAFTKVETTLNRARLQQGFATGEMEFRGQFAQQQS